MALFKNAIFTTVVAVAICLSLLLVVIQYLQYSIFQQNIHSHQQTAAMLVSSLDDAGNHQSLSVQLENKLAQLPGWQAAIYNAQGQLQWQSGKHGVAVIDTQHSQSGQVHVEIRGNEEWATRYFTLVDNQQSLHSVVVISEPLGSLNQHIQFMTNLLMGVAVVIGFILWFAFRHNTRSLKSEIRGYIRHYRKELTRDRLTGLLNREILLDRIEHSLARAERNQSQVAVLYLGLDRFSEINDQYGHAIGDQILRNLAARLSDASRASDTLVRIEGDEFALLLADIKKQEDIEQINNRIVKTFRTPVEIGGKEHLVSASIGIALGEQYDMDSETLLLNAYAAMKEVKRQGGGNIYQFYVKKKHTASKEPTKESELFKALDNEEFRLYYQPKVDIETGVINGAEAILRWQHPHRGLVSPLEFIPLLEETGLIVTVGEWVLREACRVNKVWQDEGQLAIKISVNISSVQLERPDFVDMIEEILDSSGVKASCLELEMTESCLMEEGEGAIKLLEEIKALGVSVSVDNFGTGYSSLGLLKHIPVDVLKIDRSFISELHNRKDNDNADIVMAIMALSHSLQLEVVAEGVETHQELEYLKALGCNTIQGFLYSQPLSENEFKSLLKHPVGLNDVLPAVQPALNQ